jgi:hypothetical protein
VYRGFTCLYDINIIYDCVEINDSIAERRGAVSNKHGPCRCFEIEATAALRPDRKPGQDFCLADGRCEKEVGKTAFAGLRSGENRWNSFCLTGNKTENAMR